MRGSNDLTAYESRRGAIKSFYKKIKNHIKNSNYKEKEILDYISQELRRQGCKDETNVYCKQLLRLENIFENFMKNNDINNTTSHITSREKLLYRSIFRQLAKQYGSQKYYNALPNFPRKPRVNMRLKRLKD